MSYIILNKLLYAIYTPIQTMKIWLSGARISSLVYACGSISIRRQRESIISIGHGCRFMSKEYGNRLGLNHKCMLTAERGAYLTIGDNCSFSGVTIWCFKFITLGNNVRIGANVTILDGDAHQDDPRAGLDAPVSIEDNVWVGANTLILKGVCIGKNSLIGAGSVVTSNIPPNVVAAGNPCRVVKQLSEDAISHLR